MAGTLNWQQIYGGNAATGANAANPQSQAQSGTASAPASGSQPGTLGWWLAIAGGLVLLRVVIEVRSRKG